MGSFVLASLRLCSTNKISFVSNPRAALIHGAVISWGLRLSSFLFYRVITVGGDNRLEKFFREKGENFFDYKRSLFPLKLASFWAIQAGWGIICMLPVAIISSVPSVALGPLSVIAATAAGVGICVEAVADWQKFKYKQHHKDHWCDQGLWSLARHPNCKIYIHMS